MSTLIIDRKGLIFFILVICFIFGFFILLGGVTLSREQINYVYGPSVKTVSLNTEIHDLPLPKPSTITVEQEQVRLDLERITTQKYFIVYSLIYGDQSHTAYHLFLTDLNRQQINQEWLADIWLETAEGQRIEQVAEPTVCDFPKDQPLGWKVGIIAKFPYQTNRQCHKLSLRYQGKLFELTNIEY